MCGIFFSTDHADITSVQLEFICSKLVSRGKDELGILAGVSKDFLAVHSRLSISGRSDFSHQPALVSNRWLLLFNGEIYNLKELARLLELELETIADIGDTGVLKLLLARIGVERMLDLIDGMFALVIYDIAKRKLWAAKDRFGIKPLYYSQTDHSVSIVSDPSILRQDLNGREVVLSYLDRGTETGTKSLFCEINRVLPGTLVSFDLNNIQRPPKISTISSDLTTNLLVRQISHRKTLITKSQIQFIELIERTVPQTHPPVVLFSGGIDSSLILSILKKELLLDPIAIQIGFDDPRFDESNRARELTEQIDVCHKVRTLDTHSLYQSFLDMPKIFPFPFGDSSSLAVISLFEFAKDFSKVAIGGDGGDELFSGYRRYKYAQVLKRYNLFLRHIPYDSINKLYNRVIKNNAQRLELDLSFFDKTLGQFMKLDYLSSWKNESELVDRLLGTGISIRDLINSEKIEYKKEPVIGTTNFPDLGNSSPLSSISLQNRDLTNYLPDDLMVKTDWPSLFFGVECRVPFLQKDMLFLANDVRHLAEKHPGDKTFLKDLLERYVPRTVFQRPKMGFGIPVGELLDIYLDGYVDLGRKYCCETGFFDEIRLNSSVDRFLEKKEGSPSFFYHMAVLGRYLEFNEINSSNEFRG